MTTSDGSSFAGTFQVGAGDGNWPVLAMNGNNLQLTRNLPSADVGVPITCIVPIRAIAMIDKGLRACQEISESTIERIIYGFTTVSSYHML